METWLSRECTLFFLLALLLSLWPKRISVSLGNLCSHKQTISNYPHLNGQLFVGPAGNDSRLAYNFRWSTKSRKSTSLPAVGEVLRIDQMSHPCRAVSEPWAWGQAYFLLLQFESMQGNWFDFTPFSFHCFLFPLPLLLAVHVIVWLWVLSHPVTVFLARSILYESFDWRANDLPLFFCATSDFHSIRIFVFLHEYCREHPRQSPQTLETFLNLPRQI